MHIGFRQIFRWLKYTLLITLGITGTLLVTIGCSQTLQKLLIQQTLPAIAWHYGVEFVGECTLTPWPLGLRCRQITVRYLATDGSSALQTTLRWLRVYFSWPHWQRPPGLHIAAIGMETVWQTTSGATTSQAKSSNPYTILPALINQFTLEESSFESTLDDQGVTAIQVNVTLQRKSIGNLQWHVQAGGWAWQTPTALMPFVLQTAGSFENFSHMQLDDFTLITPDWAAFGSAAWVAGQAQNNATQFDTMAQVVVEALPQNSSPAVSPQWLPCQHAHFELTGTGPLQTSAWHLSGYWTLPVAWQQPWLPTAFIAQVTARITPDKIHLPHLTLTTVGHDATVPVWEGSGFVLRQAPYRSRWQLRWQNYGTLSARGTLQPFTQALHVQGAYVLWPLLPIRLRGDAMIANQQIALSQFNVSLADIPILITGSGLLHKPYSFQFTGNIDNKILPPQTLPPPLQQWYAQAHGSFVFRGNHQHLGGEANFFLHQLHAYGEHWASRPLNVAAAFAWQWPLLEGTANQRLLQVTQFSCQDLHHQDILRGSLQWGLTPQARHILDLKITDLQMTDIIPWLKLAGQSNLKFAETFRTIQSDISGQLYLHGRPAAWSGFCHLRGNRLQWQNHSLGLWRVNAAINTQKQAWEQQWLLTKNTKTLRLTWQQRQGEHRLKLLADSYPLIEVLPDMPVLLDARVALHGKWQDLLGHVYLRTTHPLQDQQPYRIKHIILHGTANHHRLNLQGNIDEHIQLLTQLHLNPPYDFTIQSHSQQLYLAELLPQLEPYQLVFSGNLHADGSLLQWQNVQIQALVEQLSLKIGDVPLQLLAPFTLTSDEKGCHLAAAVLQSKHSQSTIEGLFNWQSLELRSSTTGSLDDIAVMLPGLPLHGGKIQAWLHLKAPWQNLYQDYQLKGQINVNNGSLRLFPDEAPFDHIALKASIEDKKLILNYLSMQRKQGHFTVEGQIALAANGKHELQLFTHAHHLELVLDQDFVMTIHGDGTLSGGIDNALAAGRYTIDSLRYSAKLELDRLLPKKNAPLRVQKVSSFPLRLNIRLFAPRNVLVSSNVLEAELGADIILKGTLAHPGLIGSLHKISATARYRDIVFNVAQASINFTDEYRMFAVFFIEAQAHACNMDIHINLSGNSDDYTLQPRGSDEKGPVSSQDILSCLQFGLRLRDFDGNQRNSANFSDALPGTLDALWMVSGLQSQVKQILPIEMFDELRLTSGWSQKSLRTTPKVVFGKALNSHLTLRYTRSIDEYDDQSLSLDYRLNQRIILQGSYATELYVPVGDFGLDLRLRWERM